MKSQRQAITPQNSALARSLVLIDFLKDVAFERVHATLEEVINVQQQLDWLLPDAEADRST
jgi:hypothetical protein